MRTAAMLCCIAGIALSGCADPATIPMLAAESQQQVQNTVIDYLRRTLAALPSGTALDATRYGGTGHNSYCDNGAPGPGALLRFHTIGELKVPGGGATARTVGVVGDIWRSWGWQVEQHAGFRRPNRFGYSPDGYRLQIVAAEGHPPTLQASSPCFPRSIARDDIKVPNVIDAG